MSRNKTIIQATPPSTIQSARVDFEKSSFDALIEQKGYRILWEKAINCACCSQQNDHALSDCQNCGGVNWVFVNPTQMRAVLHSQNIDTEYKEWSETKLGTASLTVRNPFELSFMDKITLLDAKNVYSERLYPKEISGETYAFSLYPIIDVEVAYLFVSSSTKLTVLTQGTDFTISDNIVTFADNSFDDSTISIRYIHKPQYHVIDLPRETMSTPIRNKKTGVNEETIMPIHAIVRRSHYVFDAENKAGTRLLNNSYTNNE